MATPMSDVVDTTQNANSLFINSTTFSPGESPGVQSNTSYVYEKVTAIPSYNITINKGDDPSVKYLESTARFLILFYCPFLAIAGCCVNTISMLVFSRPTMRISSMSVYIRFLSLKDLAMALTGPVVYYVREQFDLDINTLHDYSCWTYGFREYIFAQVTALTIVCLTAERFVAVVCAQYLHVVCSKKIVYSLVLVIFAACTVVNMPLMRWSWIVETYDLLKREDTTQCNIYIPKKYKDKFLTLQLVTACIIPAILCLVFNIAIIVKLYRKGTLFKKPKKPGIFGSSSTNFVAKSSSTSKGIKSGRPPPGRSTAILLILMGTCFLTCTIPSKVVPLLDRQSEARMKFFSILADLLLYTQSILNFPIYCASGRRFWHEMILMFGWEKYEFFKHVAEKAQYMKKEEYAEQPKRRGSAVGSDDVSRQSSLISDPYNDDFSSAVDKRESREDSLHRSKDDNASSSKKGRGTMNDIQITVDRYDVSAPGKIAREGPRLSFGSVVKQVITDKPNANLKK